MANVLLPSAPLGIHTPNVVPVDHKRLNFDAADLKKALSVDPFKKSLDSNPIKFNDGVHFERVGRKKSLHIDPLKKHFDIDPIDIKKAANYDFLKKPYEVSPPQSPLHVDPLKKPIDIEPLELKKPLDGVFVTTVPVSPGLEEKGKDIATAHEVIEQYRSDRFDSTGSTLYAPSISAAAETTSETTAETIVYPPIEDPVDPARALTKADLRKQRIGFLGIVALLNFFMACMAFWGQKSKIILIAILFNKSKDFLSALLTPFGLMGKAIYHHFYPLPPVEPLWILSLIPAYSESEEQIVKTIFSLRDNGVEPHKQVMVVILDGNPRDVRSHMTKVLCEFERPYVSLKWKRGTLRVLAGFMEDVPVIVIEKVKNAGKKDSLVLCHDLFNYPRDNSHLYTQLLRKEMWEDILPTLTEGHEFKSFDMIFCTDADSTIYKGAVAKLANAIARDENAIAACGLVLVELEPGFEWSFWNLYQQFQYTFGQYVRRRAEGLLGKVTCLPGCITMIAVREEMAGAIRKYAEPVTRYLVVAHQVQYLGTDRRLTYSMLSQGKHLRTLFVPDSVSETVAPQSVAHYLSQRRRWGSNAYFNNCFYMAGENMIPITRVAATIEVVRLSMVYYRLLNTALFIHGLFRSASIFEILPMLCIGQLPSIWFFISILMDPELRKRGHKLMIGYSINKCISPFMSIIIFTKVATNLGSQVWGMSGVTASSAAPAPAADAANDDDEDELSKAELGESDLPEKPKPAQVRRTERNDSMAGQAFESEC